MTTENPLSEVRFYNKPNGRWFRNSSMDLTVDFNETGKISAFQIDYREKLQSYSLSWIDFKLKDYVIDDGESDPNRNDAPIVVGERNSPPTYLLKEFEKVSLQVPTMIRDFILSSLRAEISQERAKRNLAD
jgi:hypothetical protein